MPGKVWTVCELHNPPGETIMNTHTKQGRVRIPQSLMREAGLQKDVMLVGMLNKFEIWDQNRFDALQLEDVSEELAASGVDISL